MLPALGSEVRNVSEVEDIHWYTREVMGFTGKLEEEAQVLEKYLAILH